jgi:hypothetical protein
MVMLDRMYQGKAGQNRGERCVHVPGESDSEV